MIDRNIFIDSMSSIDEDLLTEHIRRKHPTKIQKIRRYAGAAAIYAAAILVVAIALPFIIGRGDEPAPVPGDDPIKTETHSPLTDDPNANVIRAEDIYETYFDIDVSDLTEVTPSEVENLIEAARMAYRDYDVIILPDGTEVATQPKRPDITLADLTHIKVVDPMIEQLEEYIENIAPVIVSVVDMRFPEESKILYDRNIDTSTSSGIISRFLCDYYIMDPESYSGDIKEPSCDVVSIQGKVVTLTPSNGSGTVCLHPTFEENEILRRVDKYEVISAFRPVAQTEFNGCKYTLILDQKMYNQRTPVIVSVVLENDGDENIVLYQAYKGEYLDRVVFYENGEPRDNLSYDDYRGYEQEAQQCVLKPGEYIIYHTTFTPCDPPNPYGTSGAAPADINSKWDIESSFKYYLEGESDEDVKTVNLTLEVPHEEYVYVDTTEYIDLADADSIVIGDGGRSVVLEVGSAEYSEIMGYADKMFAEKLARPNDMDVNQGIFDSVRNKCTYIEFIYNTAQSFTYKVQQTPHESESYVRMFVPVAREYVGAAFLGGNASYSDSVAYTTVRGTSDMAKAVKRIVAVMSAVPEPIPTVTEPPVVAAPVVEPSVPVAQPSTTTPMQTELPATEPPVDEVITYPDPYISNQTVTSITKTLFGCEYTVTIDKPKYEKGDTVTVSVTLENKGKSELHFSGWTFLGEVYFKVNGRGSAIGHPTVVYEDTLLPGDKWSETAKFNTTEAKLTGVWSVDSSIQFVVNGTNHKESIVIEVPHDGVDENAFSPIGLKNPFSGEEYAEEFSGTGEIVIIMEHHTSLNWSSYLNTEYLGFEIENVTPWTWGDDEKIKDLVETNPNYRLFVSVFIKDKSDEAVVAAIDKLYELDRKKNFVNYVYPEPAKY